MRPDEFEIQRVEMRLTAYSTRLEHWRATGANESFQLALGWLADADRLTRALPTGVDRDELEAKIRNEAAALDALLPYAQRDRRCEIARA